MKNLEQRITQGRQYRAFELAPTADQKQFESECYVEGYVTTFQPYVLYEGMDGEKTYEQFTREALETADLSDVIFQFNHEGRVYARNHNDTLRVWLDDVGLKVAVDLSKTKSGRELYEEIQSGMITKMSWGFMPGEWVYDKNTRTIQHKTIKKVYDVSAVSIPANNDTSISARNLVDGVIEQVEKEIEERAAMQQKTLTLLKLGELLNEENT